MIEEKKRVKCDGFPLRWNYIYTVLKKKQLLGLITTSTTEERELVSPAHGWEKKITQKHPSDKINKNTKD